MKRLYIVRNKVTGKPVANVSFQDKQQAKEFRDHCNDHSKHEYQVSPGPDHWRWGRYLDIGVG